MPVLFSTQRKSRLGDDLLSAVAADRLKLYAANPDDREAAAAWAQLRAIRRTMHGDMRMAWSAPRGHDDYAASLALCLHAARFVHPAPAIVLARDRYADGFPLLSRYRQPTDRG